MSHDYNHFCTQSIVNKVHPIVESVLCVYTMGFQAGSIQAGFRTGLSTVCIIHSEHSTAKSALHGSSTNMWSAVNYVCLQVLNLPSKLHTLWMDGSLVPRLFPPPDFDCLLYAKAEGGRSRRKSHMQFTMLSGFSRHAQQMIEETQ